jgi:hypothetical protein
MFAQLPSNVQAMKLGLHSDSVTLVDLAVRELDVSPEQPGATDTVEIRTLVLNLSNVSAPVTTVFVVDEQLINAVNTTVSGLGFKFIDATWKATIGNHSLRVQVSPATADYQDVLPENNVFRRNLNVAVPSYSFTVAIVATGGNHSVQTRLFVDDVFWGKFRAGESIPLVFERSTLSHNITVDAVLRPAFGVMYVTKEPAISVNDAGTRTFNYEAQYLSRHHHSPGAQISRWFSVVSCWHLCAFARSSVKYRKTGEPRDEMGSTFLESRWPAV